MVRLKTISLAILCCASTAAVADSSLFYGTWGSEVRCSRDLIIPNGTKRWSPFEISAAWLKHDDVWCHLDWIKVVPEEDGAYAVVHALCGEDDNRDYRINFSLSGDELTLSWDLVFVNSNLRRCS